MGIHALKVLFLITIKRFMLVLNALKFLVLEITVLRPMYNKLIDYNLIFFDSASMFIGQCTIN